MLEIVYKALLIPKYGETVDIFGRTCCRGYFRAFNQLRHIRICCMVLLPPVDIQYRFHKREKKLLFVSVVLIYS